MNNMDYEKAYKDALERAKKIHDNPNASSGRKEWLESIFPELRESGDEKIRKEIIDYFYRCIKRNKKSGFRVEQIKGWIAYLEKQKIVLVQTEKERIYIRTLQGLISDFLRDHGDQTNTEFYQRCWDWLEGRHIEKKSVEWSEEDERKIALLTGLVEDWAVVTSLTIVRDETIDWLKSLRPQPHWKPSEEQMGALNYAYCELFKRGDVGHNILGPLQNLIDTLSKL